MASESSKSSKKRLWRGERELSQSPEFVEQQHREFPPGADELVVEDGVNRRQFMGLLGASMAAAGTLATGCVRKPEERIVPFVERPEDMIPGKPRFFRTATNVGSRVVGLHVESQDGRPTKVEGNPDHPMSLGKSGVWEQASVLNLYDPDRGKKVHRNGNPSTFGDFGRALRQRLGSAGSGAGMAFVIDGKPSPSRASMVLAVKEQYPDASFYRHDPMFRSNEAAGLEILGMKNATPVHSLERARVIVSIDSDFLNTDGDAIRNAKGFGVGRKVRSTADEMNRLYVVEPGLSTTGLNADERLALPSADVGSVLMAIASHVTDRLNLDPNAVAAIRKVTRANAYVAWREQYASPETLAWAKAVADDLLAPGTERFPGVAILVGERQPAWVHALAAALNMGLNGRNGNTVSYTSDNLRPEAEPFRNFMSALSRGEVKTAFFLGVNPALTTSREWDFEGAIRSIEFAVQLGSHLDETAAALSSQIREAWYVPQAHYLEAWGDLRASDGTVSIQQPLIAPLFEAATTNEILAAVAGRYDQLDAMEAETMDAGHQVLQAVWRNDVGSNPRKLLDEMAWKRALHSGVVREVNATPATPNWGQFGRKFSAEAAPSAKAPGQLELSFVIDPSVADGRFGNNGWLLECPDPATKLTWDNAAIMNSRTAEKLGVRSGFRGGQEFVSDLADISVFNRKLRIAVFVLPGVADDVVVLPVGYGRGKTVGSLAYGSGFDTYQLLPQEGAWLHGATVEAAGEVYPMATTQEHWSLQPREGYDERGIVEYSTVQEYREHPHEVAEEQEFFDHHNEEYRLFDPGVHFDPEKNPRARQQWAMVIDLSSCTGCNACVVACQAENNIPVVGKEQVLNGREMHWIRIDRYFTGTMEEPGKPVIKPIACAHCETAPCETVCPVAATQHSPDGMNDMAYNRCIGTRYCANNCPYKVRRFNFFNYQKENTEANPLLQLQRNPDVSVRFRGVMEKCTYCVQRVQQARIQAKTEGDGLIPLGGVVTACQQACPSEAIVFGDKSNPESEVAKLRSNERNYALLAYLNILPRTTYLSRLSNVNPALHVGEEEPSENAGDAEQGGDEDSAN